MKKNKYLSIYYDLLEKGSLTRDAGLCYEFEHRRLLKEKHLLKVLFTTPPEIDEQIAHFYWGSGDDQKSFVGIFTPMRQNIILLMAAMNGEL